MKKSIVSFLFICLVLLNTQAFALKNDRDVFGVFVETESKVERKKVESALRQLEKQYAIEVAFVNDCSWKTKKKESAIGSILARLEFVRPPNAESSSTYSGKPYDQLTSEYITAVPDNIDSDFKSQGYIFMYAEEVIFHCDDKIGDKKQFSKITKELEVNIEKIAKSNKKEKKPLLILFF